MDCDHPAVDQVRPEQLGGIEVIYMARLAVIAPPMDDPSTQQVKQRVNT